MAQLAVISPANAFVLKLRTSTVTANVKIGQCRKLRKVGSRPVSWLDYRYGRAILTSAAKPLVVYPPNAICGFAGTFLLSECLNIGLGWQL
jgi:hypothetical protein